MKSKKAFGAEVFLKIILWTLVLVILLMGVRSILKKWGT